jgi:TolB-like protein/DNA-binding winged helix-turn-helix (wHTH) protein
MTDPADNAQSRGSRQVYSLEDLTIDVGTAQVRRGNEPIALPRLSFDLLLALLKAAPNLVTVDELMNRVWPGIVVNAETVSQRVKLLRLALEDDPKQPRYIAVSRGRGYRILGTVSIQQESDAAAPAPPPATPTKLPRWTWVAGVSLVVAGLAALLFLTNHPAPETRPTALPDRSVAVLPFKSFGQSPQDAALAFGVAETLLHRLSASKELTVIARQSSFSFASHGGDARDIGRKLNAHFLVEGSLQSTPDRLRITAQLIDATTGSHVWSLQFDRKPEDLFLIQDEIAAKVTDALRISLAETPAVADRGTQDFDAYLAHARGRALLATERVANAKLAIADFEQAIRVDPKFARAYAGLAQARLTVAAGEMSRDRRSNLEKIRKENQELLERALAINERDSDTHLQLADLYWTGERADQELARALELNPNSAPAYRQLASWRFWRDRLPDQAIIAIDKARRLSPLESAYDNDKAQFALWGKSDVQLSEQLSRAVLDRDPSSSAALWRLGEIYWCCRAQQARGIRYLEQALKADPDFEFGRRMLILAYLELDEPKEAAAVAAAAAHPVSARLIPMLAHDRDWDAAAERSFEEARFGTTQPLDLVMGAVAVRINARTTRNYDRARDYLAGAGGISWDAGGEPRVPNTWLPEPAVGLIDVLMQKGDREGAQRLTDAVLKSIDDEAHARGRGEFWYCRSLSVIHALLGHDDEALARLEKCVSFPHSGVLSFFLANDPAYQRIRSNPKFLALVERLERNRVAQRQELEQMRASGLVPHRSRVG